MLTFLFSLNKKGYELTINYSYIYAENSVLLLLIKKNYIKFTYKVKFKTS